MNHLLFYGVVILISVNNTRQILMSGNQFKNIGSIEELFANETDKRPVMVSVKCLAYNHEKFIRQALDGFVMQKTNFRYEVLIHDDASTDSTAAIITEYAEKYPDIIKPLLEKENLFSKPDGDHINQTILPALRGKYIALCEGDDYWTDPNKLQKQVDFLEAHPDYTLCFHNAIVHYEDGSKPDKLYSNFTEREYFPEDCIHGYQPPTASMLFRQEILDSDIYKSTLNANINFGDLPLILSCMYLGKAYGFPSLMSIYRIHANGLSNKLFADLRIPTLKSYRYMAEIFKHSPAGQACRKYFLINSPTAIKQLFKGQLKCAFALLLPSFKYYPFHTIIRLLTFHPKIFLNHLLHLIKH